MTIQDVPQMPLWEHVAESGRFADLSIGSTVPPWNLVGRCLISCGTLLGSASDVARLASLEDIASKAASLPVAASEVDRWDDFSSDEGLPAVDNPAPDEKECENS